MQCLVDEHTAVDDGLAMGGRLWQLIIHSWHIVGHFVVGFLQVHLAGKFFAHLVQSLSRPVTKPVQHTPIDRCRLKDHFLCLLLDTNRVDSHQRLSRSGSKATQMVHITQECRNSVQCQTLILPVEQGGGGGGTVFQALRRRIHGEDHMQVPDHLACEPLVELLMSVQH